MRELPQILQLDVAGNPQQWIDYETSAYHYTKDNIAWSMGEVDFDIFGGTNAKTGKRSSLTLNTIIALKGKMSDKAMKHYNRIPLNNHTLFRRDDHTCAYCGDKYRNIKLSRDHVHPSSRQGKNIWTNVVTACKACNKNKGNQTPEEAHMPLLYIPYIPNRHELLILQNRRVLADQMVFLMKGIPQESRLHN